MIGIDTEIRIPETESTSLDPETVRRVLDEMPEEETLCDLAELFKVFGDSTRIKILYALLESEMCVGDLTRILGLTQTAVSHQLRILRANKLVKGRKEGKMVIYSLDDDHVRTMIDRGLEHVNE